MRHYRQLSRQALAVCSYSQHSTVSLCSHARDCIIVEASIHAYKRVGAVWAVTSIGVLRWDFRPPCRDLSKCTLAAKRCKTMPILFVTSLENWRRSHHMEPGITANVTVASISEFRTQFGCGRSSCFRVMVTDRA